MILILLFTYFKQDTSIIILMMMDDVAIGMIITFFA